MRVRGDEPTLGCAAAMMGKSSEVVLPAMNKLPWPSLCAAATLLVPDPLTVLNHCKAAALDPSALRQPGKKTRDKKRMSRLVKGNTYTSHDAGSIPIVQKSGTGAFAMSLGFPETSDAVVGQTP